MHSTNIPEAIALTYSKLVGNKYLLWSQTRPRKRSVATRPLLHQQSARHRLPRFTYRTCSLFSINLDRQSPRCHTHSQHRCSHSISFSSVIDILLLRYTEKECSFACVDVCVCVFMIATKCVEIF